MDIRYGANQADVKGYDTQKLREEFLIEKLFEADEVLSTYSHIDRIITMGVMPVSQVIALEKSINCRKNLGVEYFLERRELGIINIGGTGSVLVGDEAYKLEKMNGLYIGKESKNIRFSSEDPSNPAKFYMCSTPAHKKFETKLITLELANKVEMGAFETSNKRVIYQFIHPEVLETCQLSMGCTVLDTGCVWNSMPCHTHERRMEVYMYFNLTEENVVFHFMGEPQQTRNIVIQNEQAVISPSWSIHSGCGTSNYAFIWSMAGENRTFTDMDHIKASDLR
ncbi:5-dehydro-4-deoxy-D-glucuronate isomerase [Geosporobacter ferrireducens]|uniref:4-deoxy-L-threo-5-hexosulose-uronate ketol-isomerase n=1 Tax=Geosporobacter ferrireducens TaxID=1424294 RepID=A0A1D8GIG5_9FIRM|nr:5-dehydro-4-deoxy-D-glucuronate isomerase [Geosporobacter ferrireducens]AOT70704.1 5-dehydro-4-deoxy-D-glucuronate isomerase [Geosporobacter ferrireducens]MTI57510.1 5-dehydro-4-deoxy-D-glucuronate isomerase [Geosporobacter ferrireducens]